MLNEKNIEESSKVIKQLISEGKIVKPKPQTETFFIEKSRNSLAISQRLLDLFEEEGLDTHVWVINAAYYSMFFAATALLAKYNYKINTKIGIHKLTYHALVHYFVKEESKFKKELMEEYEDAVEEAEELLQLSKQKIEGLVTDFNFEQAKRKVFTYQLDATAERNKALTSFNRAKSFFREMEKVMS
jgi:uncharacterized protein (UPF0332 family)